MSWTCGDEYEQGQGPWIADERGRIIMAAAEWEVIPTMEQVALMASAPDLKAQLDETRKALRETMGLQRRLQRELENNDPDMYVKIAGLVNVYPSERLKKLAGEE